VGEWAAFLAHVLQRAAEFGPGLIVFDTLTNLWPVRSENDAGEVSASLMPLHRITNAGGAVLLVHHLRKGDGKEATGSRGSGALPSTVDTILELRRFDPDSKSDRRRVLTGYGRSEDTPEELVIGLAADGSGYTAKGSREEVAASGLKDAILNVLPHEKPGLTADEIRKALPEAVRARYKELLKELHRQVGAEWRREGEGKKGSPYTFWATDPAAPPSAHALKIAERWKKIKEENAGKPPSDFQKYIAATMGRPN
jgi:hypothetical protein